MSKNACYLPANYLTTAEEIFPFRVTPLSDEDIRSLLHVMRYLNIRYSLCTTGTIRKCGGLSMSGEITLERWRAQMSYVDVDVKYLMHFKGPLLEDEFFQTSLIEGLIEKLSLLKMDGINLDITAFPSKEIFSQFMEKIKNQMPSGKSLSLSDSTFNFTPDLIKSLSKCVNIFFPHTFDTSSSDLQSYHYQIFTQSDMWLKNTLKEVIPFLPFFYQSSSHNPSIENVDTSFNALRNSMALQKVSFNGLGIFDFDQFNIADYKLWINKGTYPSKIFDYYHVYFNTRSIVNVGIDYLGPTTAQINVTINTPMNGSKVRIFSSDRDLVVSYLSTDICSLMVGDTFSFNVTLSPSSLFSFFTVEIIDGYNIYYMDNIPFGFIPT